MAAPRREGDQPDRPGLDRLRDRPPREAEARASSWRGSTPSTGLEWIRLMYAYPTEVTPGLMDRLASGQAHPPLPRRPGPARLERRPQAHEARIRPQASSSAWSPSSASAASRSARRSSSASPARPTPTSSSSSSSSQSAEFDRLGAFRYSREEGSGAGDLDGQVAEEVKEERFAPPDGGAAGNRVPRAPRRRGDARARAGRRRRPARASRRAAARGATRPRSTPRSSIRSPRARPATSSRSRSSARTATT